MAVGRLSHKPEPAFAGGAQARYLETSAVAAALLEDDRIAALSIRGEGERVSSALTFTELRRVIVRYRASGRMTVQAERAALRRLGLLEKRVSVIAVHSGILERASRPFPAEPVRTLDAIHLATAESIDALPQMVTVVTRDRRVAQNARAMGFAVE